MKLNEIEKYFQTNLFEMSNYSSKTTGLEGTTMWVRTEPGVLPHIKYRVKFQHPQKGSAVFAFWGEDIQQVAGNWKLTGKSLTKVKTLLQLIQGDIIKHIDGKLDSTELGKRIESAREKKTS